MKPGVGGPLLAPLLAAAAFPAAAPAEPGAWSLAFVIALYVIGVALVVLGLIGLVLPVLPGGPLIFLGVLAVAWADGFSRIGIAGLVVIGALAVLLAVVDYLAGVVGARRFGASYWGLAGAFLGFLAGLPFGLPGLVVGPIALAVALELLRDRDVERAAKVGLGTLIGFVVGTAIKYAIAFVMLGVALVLWAV